MIKLCFYCAVTDGVATSLRSWRSSEALTASVQYGWSWWWSMMYGRVLANMCPAQCLQGKKLLILPTTTYAKTEWFYISKMPQAMRVPSCEPLHYQIMHHLGLQKLQLRLNRPKFELAITISFAWSFQPPSHISHMKDTSHPVSNGAERASLQW